MNIIFFVSPTEMTEVVDKLDLQSGQGNGTLYFHYKTMEDEFGKYDIVAVQSNIHMFSNGLILYFVTKELARYDTEQNLNLLVISESISDAVVIKNDATYFGYNTHSISNVNEITLKNVILEQVEYRKHVYSPIK
jgi:hypothetical protein